MTRSSVQVITTLDHDPELFVRDVLTKRVGT